MGNIEEREVEAGDQGKHVRSALAPLTGPTNLEELPSFSIPVDLSDSRLSVGAQLIGRPFDKADLYRVGRALESAVSFSAPELHGRSAPYGQD
jgi:aspartyl-tRNA(Asn)/glutamyl-tRNA(Gln) amidotransferase subunit A